MREFSPLLFFLFFLISTSFINVIHSAKLVNDSASVAMTFQAPSSSSPTSIPIPTSTSQSVSIGGGDRIHRFFDTFPISKTGRYLAYTELPNRLSICLNQLSFALVIIHDLTTGQQHIVDKTLAWGSQVGSHVQWGASDRELFYNFMTPGIGVGSGGVSVDETVEGDIDVMNRGSRADVSRSQSKLLVSAISALDVLFKDCLVLSFVFLQCYYCAFVVIFWRF
jgi:hypothetical protein